jgi:hypothetical protein
MCSAASKPAHMENIRYVIIMISSAQFIIWANYASAFKDDDLKTVANVCYVESNVFLSA